MYGLDSTELKADGSVLKYDSDPALRKQDPTRLSTAEEGIMNKFGGIGGHGFSSHTTVVKDM